MLGFVENKVSAIIILTWMGSQVQSLYRPPAFAVTVKTASAKAGWQPRATARQAAFANGDHIPSAFLRLSHSLQYCGHFIPGGRVPAAFAAFQSAPHARSRAIIAARPPVAGFAGFAGSVVAAGAGIGFDSAFGGASAFGGGVSAAGASPPVMHCLLKSRYFMPLGWFAAFMSFH